MAKRRWNMRQSSFNRGGMSSSLAGRQEWQPWYSGAARMDNMLIYLTGGVRKCPGTKYETKALQQDRPSRLIPFVFGSYHTYMLEFGNYVMRPHYATGGAVKYPSWHAKAGEEVIVDTPFSISQMYPSLSEIDSGMRPADYAQENTTMILAHRDVPTQMLQCVNSWEWRTSNLATPSPITTPKNLRITVDGGKDRSYLVTSSGPDSAGKTVESYPQTDAVFSAPEESGDGINTLAWDAVDGAEKYYIYREVETDTGFEFRRLGEATETTYTDSNADDPAAGADKPPEADNSFISTGEYPGTAHFNDGRLWLGGTNIHPNRLYGSKVGEFKNFKLPTLEQDDEAEPSDPLELNLSGADVTPDIVWLATSKDGLLVGSTDCELIVNKGTSATDWKIDTISYRGSAPVKPVLFNEASITAGPARDVIFGRALYMGDYETRTREMSLFNDDIFRKGRVISSCGQPSPNYHAWFVLSDGSCGIALFNPDENSLGITRRVTEGGAFEVCASLRLTSGRRRVYFGTAREINGKTVRLIETLQEQHYPGDPDQDAWHVDCGVRSRGSPRTVITGLEHLEGRRVAILADGSVEGIGSSPMFVKDGKIELQFPVEDITVGIPLWCEFKSHQLSTSSGAGTVTLTAEVKFYDTRDCEVHGSGVRGPDLQFLAPDGALSEYQEEVTRKFKIPQGIQGYHDRRLILRSRTPSPWGVLSILYSEQNSFGGFHYGQG